MLMFIFLIIISLGFSTKLRISDVSLLLSYNSTGMEISASGPNCFLWSSVNPYILEIEYPNEETCCSSVRIQPTAILEERISTMVVATDVASRETLKCEIFIDHIFSLQLLTTVRKLILYELEVLSVQALDFSENVFSSLEGLEFDWDVDNENVMRLLPLNSTEAKLDLTTEKFLAKREKPFSSDAIIAHGISIGATKVKTTFLNDEGFETSVIVDFYVVDNFKLLPGDILYVIPNSYFKYTLVRIVNETEEHLVMPYETFVWTSSNIEIAKIERFLGYFEANEVIGHTNTRVYDSEFEMNEAKGVVFVVEPEYMVIRMKQLDDLNPYYHPHPKPANDNLFYKMFYEVELQLYDKDDNRIYITDNIEFVVDIRDGADNFLMTYEGKKTILLETLQVGSFTLEALMTSEDNKFLLRSLQVFHIHPKVKIDFPEGEVIHLPLDVGIRQDYYAKAIGGKGNYQWFVLEPDYVEVTDEYAGILLTSSFGSTKLVTFDRENYHNWDERKLEVTIPHSLKFLPSVREVAVGRDLCIHLAVLNANGNAFANYSKLGVNLQVMGERIYRFHPDELGHECVESFDIFPFLAEKEGWARVEAKYKNFRDTVSIAAFPPFEIISPIKVIEGPIVVSLGASVTLQFEGGPREWKKKPRSVLTNSENVELEDIVFFESLEARRKYYIRCLDFGRQDIEFRILNTIWEDGALPTEVILVKEFSCQPPDSLSLVPLEPLTRKQVEPIILSPIRTYHVKNNQTVPVIMNLYTPHGDLFVNFSSLLTDWWIVEESVQLGYFLEDFVSYDERSILLNENTGYMKVHGEIVDYDRPLVKDSGANLRSLPATFDTIDEEIQLKVTSSLQINFYCGLNLIKEKERMLRELSTSENIFDEESLSEYLSNQCFVTTGFLCGDEPYLLFFHDRMVARGKVDGGSGTFETSSNSSDVAFFDQNKEYFSLQPLEEGIMEITSQDIHFMSITKLLVKVSDIYDVDVRGNHFVEQYHSIFLQVTPTDEVGNVFDPYQVDLMDYKLRIFDEEDQTEYIINMKDCQYGKFEIFGKRVGRTSVVASVTSREGVILTSIPFFIHVYSPFILQPEKELLLIPGAIYQVTTMGGPVFAKLETKFYLEGHQVNETYLRDEIVFQEGIDTVAEVNERGLVTAERVGEVGLKVEKWWGQVLIKTLKLKVIVVQLDSVIIVPGTSTLHEDRRVPLTLYGKSSVGGERDDGYILTPLSLQSPHFYVEFESEETHSSNTIEVQNGVFGDQDDLQYYIRWSTLSYLFGETQGYGNVISTSKFENSELYDDYSFEMTTSLYITQALQFTKQCTSNIFLPLESRYILKTNRFGDDSISYNVIDLMSSSDPVVEGRGEIKEEEEVEGILLRREEEEEGEGERREGGLGFVETVDYVLRAEEKTGLLVSGVREGAVGVSVSDQDYMYGGLLQHVIVKKPTFIDVMDHRVYRQMEMIYGNYHEFFINFKTDRGDGYVTTISYGRRKKNIYGEYDYIKVTTNDHAVLGLDLEEVRDTDFHKLLIEADGSGVATLEVRSVNNAEFGYYMMIVVKPKIVPFPELGGRNGRVRLFVGEEIIFEAVGCVQNEEDSVWMSSNPNVLRISPKTGFSQAKKFGKVDVEYHSAVTGISSVPVEVDQLRSVLFDTHILTFTIYVYDNEARRRKEDERVKDLKFQLLDKNGNVYDKFGREYELGGLRNSHISVTLESKSSFLKIVSVGDADSDGYYQSKVELFIEDETEEWIENRAKFTVKVVYEEDSPTGFYKVDSVPSLVVKVKKVDMTKKPAYDDSLKKKKEEEVEKTSLLSQIIVALCTIGVTLFFYNFFLYRLFRN